MLLGESSSRDLSERHRRLLKNLSPRLEPWLERSRLQNGEKIPDGNMAFAVLNCSHHNVHVHVTHKAELIWVESGGFRNNRTLSSVPSLVELLRQYCRNSWTVRSEIERMSTKDSSDKTVDID